jgi:tetratricopeptide (TPR) repeat protein
MPENSDAHIFAARIAHGFGARDRARELIDKAVMLQPTVMAYLNRAEIRFEADEIGREADIDNALALAPDNEDALWAKARLMRKRRDFAKAIELYSSLLKTRPDNYTALNQRGIAYALAGDARNAGTDFASVRKIAAGPGPLNDICFEKAMAGVALEQALDECRSALAAQPDAVAIMDSVAFVLLRLGRLDEAITAYDKVLSKRPDEANSLYGRGIAWSRKGEQAKADTDFVAARKVYAKIDETFASYGVTP